MAVELFDSSLPARLGIKYALVRTAWGYAAIRQAGEILTGVTLPFDNKRDILLWVKRNWGDARRDDTIGVSLQEQLIEYYDGRSAEFSVRVETGRVSAFARKVLETCAEIPAGETIRYGELSRRAGFMRAARAAGTVMAKNRYPVIIPCHRVIAADGGMGGYSGMGGVEMKRRLLEHERMWFG